MKKRLLIICSIIGVLLAGFQFPIYAEETTPDYSSSTSIITSAALDQYFYDNYELLPYIESTDNSIYINSGIKTSSELRIEMNISDINDNDTSTIFGSRVGYQDNAFYLVYVSDSNPGIFNFYNGSTFLRESGLNKKYQIFDIVCDKNNFYINGNLNSTLPYVSFNTNLDLYLFGLNNNDSFSQPSHYKLYRCSIYDYAANEGEGALVRDYYPARSKSAGIIGLYDAVSKTFVTTSGSVPFASPTGDPVNLSLGANITQFLSASLSWIGAIFAGINEMPIIWVFIAIALAGVVFRWARRIVHF